MADELATPASAIRSVEGNTVLLHELRGEGGQPAAPLPHAPVGLSVLSGSHKELVAEALAGLRAHGAGDVAMFVGGTIPAEDQAIMLGWA